MSRRKQSPQPAFLRTRANRFIIDRVAKRYGQRPSDILLDDSDDAQLRLQIDLVCMELGEEVEGLLEVRVEKKEGKRTQLVPRFSLSELLEDNFSIPGDLLRSSGQRSVYRDPRQAMMSHSGGDIVEVDEIDIEDVT